MHTPILGGGGIIHQIFGSQGLARNNIFDPIGYKVLLKRGVKKI